MGWPESVTRLSDVGRLNLGLYRIHLAVSLLKLTQYVYYYLQPNYQKHFAWLGLMQLVPCPLFLMQMKISQNLQTKHKKQKNVDWSKADKCDNKVSRYFFLFARATLTKLCSVQSTIPDNVHTAKVTLYSFVLAIPWLIHTLTTTKNWLFSRLYTMAESISLFRLSLTFMCHLTLTWTRIRPEKRRLG